MRGETGAAGPGTGKTSSAGLRRFDRAAWGAVTIVAVYFVLALAYSVFNPLFEAPDEWLHYQFIRYLAEKRALPVQAADAPTEFHQPPLYYALGAVTSAWLPVDDYVPRLNVFWRYDGQPPVEDNKNLYLHTSVEDFPYRGTALTMHVLRVFSVFLGVLTLLLAYRLARAVFAARPWLSLGTLAITAYNPQFLFSTSSVNNDVLVTLWGTAIVWWSVRVVQRGLTWRSVVAGGLLCGAALLTKLSAGALLGIVALAVWLAPPGRVRRVPALLSLASITLFLTAWWLVRNMQLYGDWSGLDTMLQAWSASTTSALPPFSAQLWNLWRSYWTEFGYGQITLPMWIYWLISLACLAGVIGLVRWWCFSRRGLFQPDRKVAAILSGAPLLLVIASVVFGVQNPSGMHGRFLLPASAAASLLLMIGWRSWRRPFEAGLDQCWSGGAVVSMLVLAVYALFGVLRPAYAAPTLLTRVAVQHSTTPAKIRFGETATLLGYRLEPARVTSGESISVVLCWEALQPTATDYYAFVHVLGEANTKIAERRTYTGLGHYPSTQWSVGEVFCDHIPLAIAADAPSGVYAVEVGLVDPDTQARLPAVDPVGSEINPIILDRLKVRSPLTPIVPVALPEPIDFGGQIRLLATTVEPHDVSAGQPVTATLYWQAARVPDKDYTVFMQLLDARGQQVANADSMPQANHYPASFWDVNEIVPDAHRLDLPPDLPPGEYRIAVGWYDLATGVRLPANGDPSGAVQIANVGVTAP
ncbi:hypothetical protein TFLX_03568 [Thermoflexales bacterium]|nr:hypothetical protein TFLX_03568 [Thermoflexales bacterium]